MSAVLLSWTSDESALSTSTRLLKLHKLSSVPLFSPSQIILTLFCLAAHFTFSKDYKSRKVQNSAAKLIFKSRRCDYVQPLLQVLHLLPVQPRVDYKLSTICLNFSLSTSLIFSLCTHLPENFVFCRHTDTSHPPC